MSLANKTYTTGNEPCAPNLTYLGKPSPAGVPATSPAKSAIDDCIIFGCSNIEQFGRNSKMVRPQNPEGTDGGTVGDISGDQSTVAVYALFVATRPAELQQVYFTGWGGWGGWSLGGGPQQGPAMSRCYSRGATFSSQFNLAWPPPPPPALPNDISPLPAVLHFAPCTSDTRTSVKVCSVIMLLYFHRA